MNQSVQHCGYIIDEEKNAGGCWCWCVVSGLQSKDVTDDHKITLLSVPASVNIPSGPYFMSGSPILRGCGPSKDVRDNH